METSVSAGHDLFEAGAHLGRDLAIGGDEELRGASGRAASVLPADGAAVHWVWSLAELADGRVAVGTENGIFILDPHTSKPSQRVVYPSANGMESLVPSLLVQHVGGEEVLWFATTSGVWRWQTKGNVPARRIFAKAGLRGLFAAPDGVWAAFDTSLIKMRGDKPLEEIAATAGLQFKCVLAPVNEDPWVGTTFGLMRVRGGKLQPANESFSRQSIRTLFKDQEGSIWAATKGVGVAQLRVAAVHNLGRAEGLPTDAVLSVLQAKTPNTEGVAAWIATSAGIVAIGRSGPTLAPTPSHAEPVNFRNLAQQRDGTLWFGWNDLFRHREQMSRSFSTASIKGKVRTLYVDRTDDLWVGLNTAGVAHYPQGDVHGNQRLLGIADGLCPGPVNFITEGTSLWFVGDAGAARFDRASGRAKCFASKMTADAADEGDLSGTTLTGLVEEPAGTVWITAVGNGGLFRIKDDHVSKVPTTGIFPPRALYAGLPDGLGNLWFTSYQGLYRVPAAELDAWTSQGVRAPSLFVVDAESGMKSSDCQSTFSPTIVPWGHGGVLVATALGLSAVRPPESLPKPKTRLLIESVAVDGVRVAWGNEGGAIRVPAAAQRIEIIYNAPTFVAGQRPRFEQRVDGIDTRWTSVGESRSAQLTRLSAGAYTFAVRLSDGAAGASSARHISFRVFAPWFLRLPALVTAAASLALLLFAVYRLRVKRIAERFATIAGERTRIARDWHDGLAQVFLGVGYQLQALRLRLAPKDGGGVDPEVVTLLDETKTMVKQAQDDVKAMLWDLRAEHDTNALVNAFHTLSDTTAHRFGVTVEVRILGNLPDAGVITAEFPRIAKEAVTNAIRHGEAQKIRIFLDFTDTSSAMSIIDNGKGFSGGNQTAAGATGSFGLVGMRERAARCGGQLFVEPAAEGGTCLRVVVNLGTRG